MTDDLDFEPERELDERPWVLALAGPAAEGRERVLKCGEQCTIGSDAAADIRVDDPLLAGHHVRVVASVAGLSVHCLESQQHVYIGSSRVQSAEFLEPGSAFVLGQTVVCIARWTPELEDVGTGGVPVPGLVGTSPSMRRLSAQIRRWAPLSAPVLLQGESGTGKDVVARALHQMSGRGGRYVAINIGALTENLADAELFGYRRGAFTGAVGTRIGVFEEAGAGTLFLDEIADLSPAVQVKLLRVLEERRMRPLGSGQEIAVSARVVSASWAKLPERVQDRKFREDLFHRISTVTLKVPPLRQRKADIGALSEHLLARYRTELGEKRLSAGALGRLVAYHWPGNIRELGAVLYRAAAGVAGVWIDEKALDAALPGGPRKVERTLNPTDAVHMLARHHGNVSAAARAARVPRTTFRALLARREVNADVESTLSVAEIRRVN